VQDPVAASLVSVEPPPLVPPALVPSPEVPPPALPPTRGARLAAIGEVVLTSGFPTQLTVGVLLLWAGLGALTPDGRLSMRYVVTLWLVDAVLVIGVMLALLRSRGEPLGPLLLGRRPALREAWLGVAMVPVVFGLVVGSLTTVRWLWPGLHNVALNPFEGLIRSRSDAVILGVIAGLGGIKEEFQRAFILRRFEQHLGGATAGLVIFSLVFGAGHFIQGWDVTIVTALLGLFWGALYLRRGSFSASAVSHTGFNVAQIVQFVVLGS